MKKISRRSFIKQLAFTSGKPEAESNDSIMVLIFLRGGADTLNMVIPHDDDEYYRARPTIGLKVGKSGNSDSDLAVPFNDFYSFHPRLKPFLPLYKEGRLSIVQAVGSDNVSGSHFEAQDQMEHGESYKHALQGGWVGRHLFYRKQKKSSPLSAVSIGRTIPESLRGAPSASAFSAIEEINLKVDKKALSPSITALSELYSGAPDLLGHAGLDTLYVLKRIEAIKNMTYKPDGDAEYPDNDFGNSLIEVARLIKADLGLEVACVDLGNWDTHFVQGGAEGLQANQIDILARGIDAFEKDIKAHRKKVTTVVMTEFGRRSYENSSLGTDHGRAFSMFLFSDRINGGRVIGDWPGIKNEGLETILGPAGLSVEIDYRDVLWEIVENILGNPNVDKVFPGFKHKELDLVVS